MKLTAAQIAVVCAGAGFRNGAGYRGQGLTWAIAVALAESGGDTTVVSRPNSDQWRSVDRGLFQINDHWHPEVSGAAAMDANANAAAAFRISGGGTSWSQWSTFKNGAAAAQLGRAALAAASVRSSSGGTVAQPVIDRGDGGFIPGLPDVGDLLPENGVPGLGDLPGGIPNPLAGAADVAGALGSIAKSAAAIASGYIKAGAWVSDPHNAARVAFVVVGSAGVLAGLVLLSRTDVGGPVGAAARAPRAVARGAAKTAKTAAGAAGTVATGGAGAAAGAAAKTAKTVKAAAAAAH